jgi:hypothetical protein
MEQSWKTCLANMGSLYIYIKFGLKNPRREYFISSKSIVKNREYLVCRSCGLSSRTTSDLLIHILCQIWGPRKLFPQILHEQSSIALYHLFMHFCIQCSKTHLPENFLLEKLSIDVHKVNTGNPFLLFYQLRGDHMKVVAIF